MYGGQDASYLREKDCSMVLMVGGFKLGISNDAIFNDAEWKIRLSVHGDDFIALSYEDGHVYFEELLRSHYDRTVIGAIGLAYGSGSEMVVLNRVLCFVKVRIRRALEYEADVRHVQVIAHQMELESCDSVSAPGIKHGHDVYMAELESPLLDQWRKSSYCSVAMRMSCLSQDRGDIREAVENVGISYTESQRVRLCRARTFSMVPQKKPRVVLAHPEQALSKEIYGLRDAGQAWCVRTRRNDQRQWCCLADEN